MISHDTIRGRHRYAIETGLKYGLPEVVDVPAIVAHGGVIGVVFLPYFLREPEEQASIEDVLDCIDHICQLVGPDHAGLGSDFDGFGGVLPGLDDVTKMGAIGAGLRKRGFSDGDIAKVTGLNFLRVWDAVAAQSN